MKLKDLAPNPSNPRKITDEKLAMLDAAIQRFGSLDGFIFNRRFNRLCGGHQRQKIDPEAIVVIEKEHPVPTRTGTVAHGFINLKGERFPYRVVDWDAKTEKAANIAANKGAGEWDFPQLGEWMKELEGLDFDLDLTMFDEDERAGLKTAGEEEGNEGLCDPDETPEVPKESKVRLGDLWELGGHRLLCGDSTKKEDVERLMVGEKAAMVFTDPPYNVAGKTQMESLSKLRPNSYGKLKNSSWDQDFDPSTLFPSLELVLSDNSSVYVCCSHFLAGAIWCWMDSWGDYYGGCVWTKNNPMPSMHKRHWTWDHEHICYATKGKHVFNFPSEGHAKATWEIAKSPANDLHPTQKPIAIPEHAVLHSSVPESLVVDLFLGSGSTLIACEKTNRRCFGMEIDPLYCSVILDRWAKFTGKDPVREDGVKWSEIK